MSSMSVERLLDTGSIAVSDVRCAGGCRHESPLECSYATHIVFPYHGVYVRHVGDSTAVADANQMLFFNGGQEYRISHPVEGGDSCLSLSVAEPVLQELAPGAMLQAGGGLRFLRQHLRIDAHTQALLARLRTVLQRGAADALQAETLCMDLLRSAFGTHRDGVREASHGKRKLAERVKLLLSSDPARRWTLADIAAHTGGSPVYLTQVFQQVEGMPLYRYQLQLRLARALALIGQYDDLSAMSFDLGFSSHSHFSASFRQAYGSAPSAFRMAR
jgi:AraC family transcriptional regulator